MILEFHDGFHENGERTRGHGRERSIDQLHQARQRHGLIVLESHLESAMLLVRRSMCVTWNVLAHFNGFEPASLHHHSQQSEYPAVFIFTAIIRADDQMLWMLLPSQQQQHKQQSARHIRILGMGPYTTQEHEQDV